MTMGIKQTVLDIASKLLKAIIGFAGKNKAPIIAARLVEDLSPTVCQNTEFGEIKFFCPGKIPVWRAQTLLTKEPETLAWIETFKTDDVLWDIGANLGVYSLYAAMKGNSVLSFEPSPFNYYLLSKNIEFNELDHKILAYCMAFSDVTKLDTFFMANTDLGGALNSFGEAVDWQGRSFTPQLRQAMMGFSVDYFISQFSPPFPSHFKIDVDGIEDKIIAGAEQTLTDSRLKSVLIELDTSKIDDCEKVISVLEKAGLGLVKKEHAPQFDKGRFSTVFNHIFTRFE